MTQKRTRKPKPKAKGPKYSGISGVDPYVDWAFGPGKQYFPTDKEGKTVIPVLVQLNGISAARFARASPFIEDATERRRWRLEVKVPSLYTRPPRGLERTKNCTALVTQHFFDVLKSNKRLAGFATRVTLGLSLTAERPSSTKSSRSSRMD